jgi:Leu/Phe-tRNA-protein transferase
METILPLINPEHLTRDILEAVIYPAPEADLYYSECWDKAFYRDLARAGFISIAHDCGDGCYLLLPEMQKSYAVLDWENLHYSRHIRRMIRQGRLDKEQAYVTINRDTESVINRIVQTYGPRCWLVRPYRELMKEMQLYSGPEFSLIAVELWSGRHNVMICGELGYTIGGAYTSLTGFLDRGNPVSNTMGTVQLLALARLLQKNGYKFWNLGHPHMEYKVRIGARILPRPEFLKRWLHARELRPAVALDECAGVRFSCLNVLTSIALS